MDIVAQIAFLVKRLDDANQLASKELAEQERQHIEFGKIMDEMGIPHRCENGYPLQFWERLEMALKVGNDYE